MSKAAGRLVFSSDTIMEIALDCGYESQQSFTAAFTAMYKLSPASFRWPRRPGPDEVFGNPDREPAQAFEEPA